VVLADGVHFNRLVARNLGRLRQDRGLSQEELAHRVGINRHYVGMIEHEENSPTVETIERLCKALDADPALLFRRSKT
jgi:transcriptional regulator with XRE-family HTH domain